MTDSLLSKVRAVVDGARVPYMIVGSFASYFHGTPRSTHDLDIVIDPTREGLLALLERFPAADDDVSHEAAFDALSARSQFHVAAANGPRSRPGRLPCFRESDIVGRDYGR